MESTLNYQFNYGPHPQPAPAPRIDPDAPMYASQDGVVASLSSQECIFLTKRGGESHVMTFQVLQALDQCREFRSLDEHIARIQTTIPVLAGKRDDVRRVLENLCQRQLLMSDRQFIDGLRTQPRERAPFRAVFIRACDSPTELQRLMTSLVDYERRYRGNRHYVVLDDSALPAHINEQRDLLREFARTTGCKVSYVGQPERTRLVDKIGKAVPQLKGVLPRLLLREAQGPAPRFGGGRGHNLALLLGAGARIALLDDDMRLPLKRPDFARPGLDPNPASHTLVRFYENAENVLAAGDEVERDPFELHLDACGESLGSLADYQLERSALRGLNLGRLDLFTAASFVVSTHQGHYGSSGADSAAWLYDIDAESRADFWRDRASYLRNMEAQFIWFGVRQARTLAVGGFTPFTLDDSMLLPCTNPFGRGEDQYGSTLTRFCHPDALALEVPEAIGHLQETTRRRTAEPGKAYAPALNQFLHEFTERQSNQCKAADPAQRLGFLAAMYRDLAGASRRDRTTHLHEYLSYARADVIDRLQHQLDAAAEAPIYWQTDVRAIIQRQAKALLAKAPPRLDEWPEDIDENGCADALTVELNAMAEALEHWPAAWNYAAEQGEKLLLGL